MKLFDLFRTRDQILDPKTGIASKKAIARIIADPEFPYLISFPRTGSHWLRMLMELYFDKPSLALAFYNKEATEFTCYHRHDESLDIQGIRNVIYLYRDPVETIYSQMNYHKEPVDDAQRQQYWSDLYGRHLQKWLFNETFTKKKLILS
ncbi:MAG: hypothetical protein AAFO94_20265, partial [Bacteroidota bacterium]